MSNVVIRVNGSPVSFYEYNTVLQEFALGQRGEERSDRPPREELEKLAFERIVARELIYQAALAEGLIADEPSVVAECRRAVEGFRSEAAFLQALEKAGGDPQQFQRSIRKDVTVAKMSAKVLESVTPPDAQAIAAFHAAHPERLRQSATYDLRQLLLPCEPGSRDATRERIMELKQQLPASDFVSLIRDNSECPSAMNDGELRGVRVDQMASEIHQTLESLAPGEVGGPIETPSGFHLIEKLAFIPERTPPLEECREEIAAYLFREKRAAALQSWVDALQEGVRIEDLRTGEA